MGPWAHGPIWLDAGMAWPMAWPDAGPYTLAWRMSKLHMAWHGQMRAPTSVCCN